MCTLRVLCKIAFVYLQELTATNNNESLVDRQSQNFIHCQQLSFADTTCLSVLWCIVGDTPGTQHLCFAENVDRNLSGAFADVLCRKFIHASEEELHITVSKNLLPLV